VEKTVFAGLGLLVSVSLAHADIYRYVDDDGVECYTDSRTTAKAVVYLKESKKKKRLMEAPEKSRALATGPKDSPPSQPSHLPDGSETTTLAIPLSGRITSRVGLRHDPIDGLIRNHQGIDIATPEGTPIRPIAPGIVSYSGYRQGYGKTIIIEHLDGMVSIYAHHSVNLVTEGAKVTTSTVIALSGSTGRSTGPHLHFEAWQGGDNITASIIGSCYGNESYGPGITVANDGIRRFLKTDGTLVLTNLP
jgi:murein DD-endopeptidase MepM/ murein hydrolase activator NlpD